MFVQPLRWSSHAHSGWASLKENFVDLHYLLETAQLIEQGLLWKGLSEVTADNCVTLNCLYQERATPSITAFASHSAEPALCRKGTERLHME